MNVKRLKRLANLLDDVTCREDIEFDMCRWCITNVCGTTCCALGLAAMDPVLNEQGLRLVPSEDTGFNDAVSYNVMFRATRGYEAATYFFGIKHTQALYIFHPVMYYDEEDIHNPYAVIQHIVDVMDGYNPIVE